MKTIEIKLYEFSELSEDAKQNAINEYKNSDHEDQFYFDEIIQSAKKVIEIFGFEFGREYSTIKTMNIDDDVLSLSGLRLQKYIYNNFYHELFTPKIYSLWSKKEKSFKHHKDGFPVLKRRHSRIFKTNDCVLTGVCYDMDILKPVYDFLENPCKNTTFEDLIKSIEHSIDNCFYNTEKWINSDEFIIDHFEANDYEFKVNGEIY